MATGRKPKPTHLHIIEGTFDVSRHKKRLKTEPKPVGKLSDPPAWFSEAQQAVWAYGLESAPAGLLKAIDLSTYVAWVVACDLHRQAAEELSKWRFAELLIRGPRGQVLQNPLIEIINRQALIMMKHASEMGFTPSGRTRVAVDPKVEVNPFDEFA